MHKSRQQGFVLCRRKGVLDLDTMDKTTSAAGRASIASRYWLRGYGVRQHGPWRVLSFCPVKNDFQMSLDKTWHTEKARGVVRGSPDLALRLTAGLQRACGCVPVREAAGQ